MLKIHLKENVIDNTCNNYQLYQVTISYTGGVDMVDVVTIP